MARGAFALVRLHHQPDLHNLFFDEEVFDADIEDIEPLNEDLLLVYSLVNRHSETNLINLALASGALAYGIGLDDMRSFPPAATAQSTFSFEFRPSSALPDVALAHQGGQVEVDAIFVPRLRGARTLFVLEGKNELAYTRQGSLSGTKLLYAANAVHEPHHPISRSSPSICGRPDTETSPSSALLAVRPSIPRHFSTR